MLFARKQKGQGLVEYALILVLVAIVVIAALMILGPIIGNTFSTINASLTSRLGSTTKNPESGIRHLPGPALCFKYGIAIFPV